jgi:uncharacterized protein (DUF924 family)|tara:strand:+ start:334 stop:894 length:561 start_codon:yes stop_codon:yes gene_type:complete
MSSKINKILDFWFVETSAEKKFKKDLKFDQVIKDKFWNDYELAIQNKLDDWQNTARGCLALIILLDQFSRNIFRENKKAFAQDEKSKSVLLKMIENNFLDKMNETERLFALLPLIHSENISDHEKAYVLMDKYLKKHSEIEKIKKFWLDHTVAIKKFGRYPHRNKVLHRVSSNDENKFLNSPNSSW